MIVNGYFIFVLLCAIKIAFAIDISISEDDLINTLFENKKECFVKELITGLEKPCEFPFIYEGRTYYGCSTYVKYKDGRESFSEKPWCSTRTEPISTQHITGGGLYGDCPQDGSCSTAEEGQVAENIWEQNELGKSYKYYISDCFFMLYSVKLGAQASLILILAHLSQNFKNLS